MITKKDLGTYATRILDLFDKEKIRSLGELEKRMGKSFKMPEGNIELSYRPSGILVLPDSLASSISYVIEEKGIPIEIRLNAKNDYTKIMIKSNSRLEGYSLISYIAEDMVQFKSFELSFNKAMEELRKLKNQ